MVPSFLASIFMVGYSIRNRVFVGTSIKNKIDILEMDIYSLGVSFPLAGTSLLSPIGDGDDRFVGL